MENQTNKAYLAATSYAVIIGLSFLCSKVALQYASPMDVLAFRFSVSFLAFLVLKRISGIEIQMSLKRLVTMLPAAICYPVFFFSLQAFGLMNASSAEGGIIHASAPVFVMIFARCFLQERLSRAQKISVLVSVSGVIFILLMKGASIDLANLKGLTLLVLSVLFFAGYNVLARKLGKGFTTWELSYVMMALGAFVFLIVSVGSHLILGSLADLVLPVRSGNFIAAILYLGVLSTMGSAVLNNYALSILEASRVSVFGNLGTIISLVAGVLFLNETLHYYHLLGTALIVLGVIGTNYFAQKQTEVTVGH